MHFTKSIMLGFVPVVFTATMQVMVGPGGGLTFAPNSITAKPGDSVQFLFATQNHTVTAGDPNTGCKPSGLFNSGFVPAATAAGKVAHTTRKVKSRTLKSVLAVRGENGIFIRQGKLPSFTVKIKDDKPITVYCAQAQHCQAGMVMTINPAPNGASSLAAYKALCAKAKTNTPAKSVTGGTLAYLVKSTKTKGKGAAGAAAGKSATAGTGAPF